MTVMLPALLSTIAVPLSAAERPPASVRVAPVQRLAVQPQTRLVGSIQAARRVAIAAEESGRLLSVAVDVGDQVAQGAVVARIDGDALDATIAEAEAGIAATAAAVRLAAAQLERAKADAKALTQAAEQQAVAAIDARRAGNSVSEAQASLTAREADHAAAKARLQTLKVRQDDLSSRAPFAGHVVRRLRDPGAWVRQGDALVEVVAAELEVVVDVPERFYHGVTRHADNLQALIAGSADPLRSGSLRIIRDLNPSSRTFPVVASLPPSERSAALAAGLSVQVDLPIGAAAEHLVLPAPAIIRGGDPYCFVLRQQPSAPPKAMRAGVTVLFSSDHGVAISSSDLQAGDLVVVEGNERLAPGAAVSVVDPDADGRQNDTQSNDDQAGARP